MDIRLFIEKDGEQLAALNVAVAPRVGDLIWFKAVDGEGSVEVLSVEHQLDRSNPESYSKHDVVVKCRAVAR